MDTDSSNKSTVVVGANFLDAQGVANALGTTIYSVRYHIRKGRIKPFFKLGRRMFFEYDHVIKQLKRGVSS